MADNGHGPRSLAGFQTRSAAEISSQKHEGSDWLIEGIMPQGCFLVVGRPKVGKSWFLLQTCFVLTTGGKLLGHESLGQFDTLYIASEDDPGRIAERLAHYKTQCPKNLSFICRDDLKKIAAEFAEHYSLAEFIDVLLAQNPNIKALIIDTESTVRAEWDGGSIRRDVSITRNDYAEVREFDEIAHRRRVWIALVNHTAKRKNGSWVDIHELINRTNTALAGASGSIVLADPPGYDPTLENNDSCKVLGIRGRDILKDHLLAVEQDDFAVFREIGPYNKHRQTELEKELMEAIEEMIEAKATDDAGWITSSDLAGWVGRRAGAVQRALSRMLARGVRTWKQSRIESSPKKGYRLVAIEK